MPRRSSIVPSAGNPLVLPVLALLALMAVYVRSIDHSLSIDDRLLSVQNWQVNGSTQWRSIWLEAIPPRELQPGNAYRPVFGMLLRFELAAWGESPSSFHGLSLCLFFGSICMFLALVRRMTASTGAQIAAAVVFALHPMATQSLMTITGQAALWSLLGALGAMLVVALWRQGALSTRNASLLLIPAVALAVGSHEMGFLAPFWMLAAASAAPVVAAPVLKFQKRGADAAAVETIGGRISAGAVLALALPTLMIALEFMVLRQQALGPVRLEGPDSDWLAALPNPRVLFPSFVAFYLGRLVLPVAPTILYEAPGPLPSFPVGAIVLGILFAMTLVAWRKSRFLALGLTCLTSALLALSHLLPLGFLVSEEPLLFALPGLAISIAAIVLPLAQGQRVIPPEGVRGFAVAAALLVIAAGFAFSAARRAGQWTNEIELWRAEAALHPAAARPHTELAALLFQAKDPAAARAELQLAKGLASPREYERAVQVESKMHLQAGDLPALRRLLTAEVDSTREHAPGHFDELSRAARRAGMPDLFEALLRRELKIDPQSYYANFELAKIEYNRRNDDEAIRLGHAAAANAAIENRAVAYAQFAEFLRGRGDLEKAAYQFEEALKVDPGMYAPYVQLAKIYWGRKEYARVEQTVNRAFLNTRPNSIVELSGIYTGSLIDQQRGEEAIAWLKGAVTRFPGDLPLKLLTADTLIRLKDFDGAEFVLRGFSSPAPVQNAVAMLALAKVAYLRDGNRAVAVDGLRAAQRIAPDEKAILDMLTALGEPIQPRESPRDAASSPPGTAP